jgi:tetratricopeptide (TPR) repeat protein
VEKAYTRARELCRQIGESPHLFRVLLGLCGFYHQRAALETARELAEQCVRLAQRLRNDVAVLAAYQTLGSTLHFMGELSPAREHLEQGIALYDPARHHIQDPLQDLGVGCFSQAASVLWLLGYPDQALPRSQEALALARQLSHPFSIAYALGYASRVHALRQEQQAALALLEEQMALASEQGFDLFMAQEPLWRGRVLSEQGRVEEGIAQMRQGLVAYQATGSVLGRPFILARLAEAYGKVGQVEAGLTVVAEALTAVEKTAERVQKAELYRLRGELLLQHAVA